MTDVNSNEEIINYYDTCEQDYRKWWDLEESLSMHAGYWDATTKTLREALVKENQIMAEIARITNSDKILDAGCGFGGSALYLAAQYDCHVTGITLSERQVEVGQTKAKERGLAKKVNFLTMDFTKTRFPAQSFDVVWAIESVCHTSNKQDFIKEAWRLLRPGGRLIVADGFNVKTHNTPEEKRLIHKAMSGWAVQMLESISRFEDDLKNEGFQKIEKRDVTANVLPSSKKLFFYSFPAITFSKIGELLGWSTKRQTDDFKSYFYQYKIVKKGLSKYYFIYAEKPLKQ